MNKMDEVMSFPETWEEFEKMYGFTDRYGTYTNRARLIPSFRVEQWLNHLESEHKKQSDFYPCADEDGMVDVSDYPYTKENICIIKHNLR